MWLYFTYSWAFLEVLSVVDLISSENLTDYFTFLQRSEDGFLTFKNPAFLVGIKMVEIGMKG